jgi:hypothetical protein
MKSRMSESASVTARVGPGASGTGLSVGIAGGSPGQAEAAELEPRTGRALGRTAGLGPAVAVAAAGHY